MRGLRFQLFSGFTVRAVTPVDCTHRAGRTLDDAELVIAIWHDREARQSCRVLAADLVVKLGSGKVAALAQAFEDCTTLADWLIG
ncbi:hypothetical protein [Pseudomonas syringae]|uniref:hypothetical protein n=1 Tax=Pseudomonas syringae TaxID=317 RepID=UPI00155DB86D|nr:hypothetical protein [Pseudomonas syringae]